MDVGFTFLVISACDSDYTVQELWVNEEVTHTPQDHNMQCKTGLKSY